MMRNLKTFMLGGLGAVTVVGGLLAASVPAMAFEGDNHYSRQHPGSWAYDDRDYDPAYAAGGVVAGAGDVAGDVAGGALAGAGDIVAGTVGGVTGTVAGVTDPYDGGPGYQSTAGHYGGGRVIYRNGQPYVRHGAYYYPTGAVPVRPRADGYHRAGARWDWSSDGQYRRGTVMNGTGPGRSDYYPGSMGPDGY